MSSIHISGSEIDVESSLGNGSLSKQSLGSAMSSIVIVSDSDR